MKKSSNCASTEKSSIAGKFQSLAFWGVAVSKFGKDLPLFQFFTKLNSRINRRSTQLRAIALSIITKNFG
ncbi:MAG: hypothetical protein ACRC2R_15120 [Xenococcaceae cyanobacterium]